MTAPKRPFDDGSVVLDRERVHELCNLLSIVLGFADLLLADAVEGTREQADLAEIRSAADAAMRLVRQAKHGGSE